MFFKLDGTDLWINIGAGNIRQIEFMRETATLVWFDKSGMAISHDDARAIIAATNGTPPAADVPAETRRHIVRVEKFISRSGNESWKAESIDALMYFRQANREMLQEAGLWDELNEMHIGETLQCHIDVYTVPDGDFHKIVRIEPGGHFFDPDDDGDDWEDIEDEPEDVPMLGLDPREDEDLPFAHPHIAPLELPETDDEPDGENDDA